MRGAAAGVLFAVFLAWRSVASAGWIGGELARREPHSLTDALQVDQEERIRRALASWEKLEGLPQGREFALFRAVREHVPPRAQVVALGERGPFTKLAFSHLSVLLYPRRFVALERVPENWREILSGWGPQQYLLELEERSGEPLGELLELLAEGEHFRLWRRSIQGR